MDVAVDLEACANGVAQTSGMCLGLHPFTHGLCGDQGVVQDADAELGKVADSRENAAGGCSEVAFNGEACGRVTGDD